MSITYAHDAMIAHLITMTTDAGIVLPEGPGKPLPRYVVQEAGGAQATQGLTGITDSSPAIMVRVETERGVYTTKANEMIAALVEHFAVGTKFGNVSIINAPSVRPPMSDSGAGVYAVPVMITGKYTF